MWFYGDFCPNEDARAFLAFIERYLFKNPHLTEPQKCEALYTHLSSGWEADNWYEELKSSAPEVLTSWPTFCKHFCIKWLGTSPSILLKIPKIEPLTVSTATMTPRERAMHRRDDASRHLLPPTTNSQPLNNAPTSPKLDPIMPNTTQTAIKPPANKTKPEAAVATISNVMVNTNTVTRYRTKERVSREGRKEKEEARTVFEDTREEVRGEEETTREKCTDAHPTDDDPTNQMPMPLNWAKDVDEFNGVRPVVSVDMSPPSTSTKRRSHRQFHMAPATCQLYGQAPTTHGAPSTATTINTTVPSHHTIPQPSAPPHEPLGTKTVTATIVFTHRTHHHLVSHTPRQSTSSKRSTCRGLPPRSPSSEPRPLLTTTRHVPPFDPFRQATFLRGNSTQWTPIKTPTAGYLPHIRRSVPLWCHLTG